MPLIVKASRAWHSPIAEAVDKWLLAVGEVLGLVERTGIPHDFVHDLRDANWMRFRALRVGKAALRVGRVGLGNLVSMIPYVVQSCGEKRHVPGAVSGAGSTKATAVEQFV